MRKHFHIIHDAAPDVFVDLPLVVFRRCKNTQDLLVSSKFSNIPLKPIGTSPCGAKICTLCPKQIRGSSVNNSVGKPTYSVRGRFHCNSKNVVYLLHCGVCNIQYIGQTGKKFRGRYWTHSTHSNPNSNYNFCPQISHHVKEVGHPFKHFQFAILGSNFKTDRERLAFEQLMIELFDTENGGLNASPGMFT